MPVFAYEGKSASGDLKKGEIEAVNPDAARIRLRQMQISATSVKPKGTTNLSFNVRLPAFLKGGVKTKDLVIFTRQFATMIDSGLPLVQCLEIQSQQAPNVTFRGELKIIKESVESGSTFADALGKYPKTFDELYRNLVAAGEVGGILDTILSRLATYLEKNDKLKRQVKGAMTYPTIVLAVAGVVVAILLLKVVPTFESMFAEFGGALPAPTQFVIDLSRWLQHNFLYVLAGIGALIFGLRYAYRNSAGRVVIDRLLLRLPVLGDVLTKVAVARFCRTLGTMVSSGVPILDALDICSKTAGNRIIEMAVQKTRDSIAEGRTIAEPLMATKTFPDMVCQMIAVGEATGALDVMLNKIADFYEDETDQAVENLTSMMEPLIMAFLGVVVGGLAISMYLPIFTMASAVGGG
jgi:type IV pilus assembly protein PilC